MTAVDASSYRVNQSFDTQITYVHVCIALSHQIPKTG